MGGLALPLLRVNHHGWAGKRPPVPIEEAVKTELPVISNAHADWRPEEVPVHAAHLEGVSGGGGRSSRWLVHGLASGRSNYLAKTVWMSQLYSGISSQFFLYYGQPWHTGIPSALF